MIDFDSHDPAIDEREAALADFREVAAERRRLAIRGARAVLELRRTNACFFVGASSIAHLAELNGMAAWEARELEHLADALERDASLEQEVLEGTIPVTSASILGEIAMASEFVRGETSDDEWRVLARTKSTRELRRMFLRQRDALRAGEPVAAVTAYVTRSTAEDLERARALTSRKQHYALTMGQTLGIVVGEWLDEHDPLRTEAGTRRLPDTATIPGERYVPAEVDRAVRARTGDRCIVPFCDGVFWIQRSHRVAHRHGGSREADNLDLLCDTHHLMYELGEVVISGPTSAPRFARRDGRPLEGRWEFDSSGSTPRPSQGEGPTSSKPPDLRSG